MYFAMILTKRLEEGPIIGFLQNLRIPTLIREYILQATLELKRRNTPNPRLERLITELSSYLNSKKMNQWVAS